MDKLSKEDLELMNEMKEKLKEAQYIKRFVEGLLVKRYKLKQNETIDENGEIVRNED